MRERKSKESTKVNGKGGEDAHSFQVVGVAFEAATIIEVNSAKSLEEGKEAHNEYEKERREENRDFERKENEA